MNKTNHRTSKDFNRKLVAALNKRGVFFVGSTWVPGADGSCANGETAYELDDNGMSCLRTYAQVKEMAKESS
jgi:hypothetical protein